MPKVTVLMAVYNGERFLREAIESILYQSYKDFEFLIINDGSTDNSRNIILSYNDSRIRLIDNNKNLGLTQSLNIGLKLAEGKYIARQDADDISDPERIEKQVSYLENHQEVALLGSWYKEINEEGKIINKSKLPCDHTEICWYLWFFCPFVHSAVMLRKLMVIEKVGFYNESFVYAQDRELWFRICRVLPAANLDEYLIKLRINPHSMTATYGAVIEDEDSRILSDNLDKMISCSNDAVEKSSLNSVNIKSFLLGFGSNLNLKNLDKDTDKMLSLFPLLFCDYYGIDSKHHKEYRKKLHYPVAHQLLKIASDNFNNNFTETWNIIFKACRIHWPILIKKQMLFLILKLITGNYLQKMKKSILKN